MKSGVVVRVVLLILDLLDSCAFLRERVSVRCEIDLGERERTEIPKAKHVEVR